MNYLYDDALLAVLPDVTEKYRYALMFYQEPPPILAGEGQHYAYLFYSTEPILSGDQKYKIILLGDVLKFGLSTSDFFWEEYFELSKPLPPFNEWVELGEGHFDERTEQIVNGHIGIELKWANHNIYKEDGTLYLAASYPIDPETGEEITIYDPNIRPVPQLNHAAMLMAFVMGMDMQSMREQRT